jgi:hypothetical protein
MLDKILSLPEKAKFFILCGIVFLLVLLNASTCSTTNSLNKKIREQQAESDSLGRELVKVNLALQNQPNIDSAISAKLLVPMTLNKELKSMKQSLSGIQGTLNKNGSSK